MSYRCIRNEVVVCDARNDEESNNRDNEHEIRENFEIEDCVHGLLLIDGQGANLYRLKRLITEIENEEVVLDLSDDAEEDVTNEDTELHESPLYSRAIHPQAYNLLYHARQICQAVF